MGRRARWRSQHGAVYLLLWMFLAGGIIDRTRAIAPTRGAWLLLGCRSFSSGSFRLALVAGVVYLVMFTVVHPWMFWHAYTNLTPNATVERTAALTRLGLYLLFGGMLAVFNLLFDYAKVRLVSEGRYSALGALRAAGRLVARQPLGVAAVYLSDVLLFGLVVLTYTLVAPGAGSAGWSMWLGVAISQAYIAARLWVKLVFWSSETVYFQGSGIREQGSGVGAQDLRPAKGLRLRAQGPRHRHCPPAAP